MVRICIDGRSYPGAKVGGGVDVSGMQRVELEPVLDLRIQNQGSQPFHPYLTSCRPRRSEAGGQSVEEGKKGYVHCTFFCQLGPLDERE